MAFRSRWVLILFALLLGGGQLFAAGTREERAYAAAQAAFQDQMWNRAETEFAAFIVNYPESPKIPMAVLWQAQAEFKQGDFTNAIALLAAHQMQAKTLADQYCNWTGEAQFAGGDFPAAAETFTALADDFTNSTLRLSATVNAAAARAQLAQWPQVENLLEAPDGVFQKMLLVDRGSELILRGQLLRAQAKSAQKNYNGATAILASKNLNDLPPELAWPWAYLFCQTKLAAADLNAALSASTNLLQIAGVQGNQDWLGESVALHAGLLEKAGLTNDAIAAYQQNLTTNTPVQNQQQAILKIAELSAAQNQFTNAESKLDNFLAQFPDSPAADVALLSVGELHLKNFSAQPAATNESLLAKACLDQFVGTYTNSQYLGKAYLDRGWFDWLSGNAANSAADFKLAVENLPASVDLAVAHFKLGDALLAQNDFAGALENYHAVTDGFADFPAVAQMLEERALYQSLRASLSLNDPANASNAVARILRTYPEGDLSDNAILLFGESVADSGRPNASEKARELFQQFVKQFPHSELLPQAQLAIARSYEQESNWPAAITNYQNWLTQFPTNELKAQAIYATALANYQAGNETNALTQFTQFIAQFPTNLELAPQAQWWLADYFFRAGNFAGAETNYENIYQNPAWKNSTLFYPAQLMAGRSAMGRQGFSDAVNSYFNKLISDTNCPADLGVQARFACAAALEQTTSADTNNPLANFSAAIGILSQIVQMNPTNDATARAWGEIGKCDFQMNNFDAATNAYAQVFSSAAADIAARSSAQIGFGLVLEKRAELATGDDQTNFLNLALQNYSDVFYQNNLRDGEMADPFWVKKAGLQAAGIAGALGNWDSALAIYTRLETLLPQLKESLDKKIPQAGTHLPAAKN
jgi:TolA-binding protein